MYNPRVYVALSCCISQIWQYMQDERHVRPLSKKYFSSNTNLGWLFSGVREQINAITAFIDGSNIYGSTLEISKELREERGTGRKCSLPFDPLLVLFVSVWMDGWLGGFLRWLDSSKHYPWSTTRNGYMTSAFLYYLNAKVTAVDLHIVLARKKTPFT